jgi:hypothetical protein
MAARVRDGAARELLRRLLRDEARHIRLHRELLARQLARLGVLGRLKARVFAFLFRWAFFVTAWYQARQLAPILGEAGPPLRGRSSTSSAPTCRSCSAARPRPVSLDWWWARRRRRAGRPTERPRHEPRARNRRRIRIVVNPSARSGRGPRLLRDLAATMTGPAPLEWVVSRSAAHLRDLVAEAEDAGPR